MMSVAATLAPWRFATRLAHREVRRHPWRGVLVVFMVALPVAGMTIFSVIARTTNDGWFAREYGDRTDLYITRSLDDQLDVYDYLPAGSTSEDGLTGWAAMESETEVVDGVEFHDGVAFGAGDLSLREGRAPRRGEVWLSSVLADEFGVDVGDTLTLRHPSGQWTVSGVGESQRRIDARVLVMPDLPVEQFRPGIVQRTTFVDLPPTTPPADVGLIGSSIRNAFTVANAESDLGGWAAWDEGDTNSDEVAPLAWTWVVGTIALAATGIIIAAAFATSARRQLVTIGLLSSNGSSERMTRQMLALQGAWTGLAGSVLGVALGIVALLGGRSFFEDREGYRLGHYQFGWLYLLGILVTGIVTATVAALLPARSASKVPVMAALAGRRPLGAVPPRLVRRGLAFAAVGALLLVMGALSRDGGAVPTVSATIGGLFVLIGMCFCSPLAVDWVGRASGRLSGSWRLAGRSLGRTRTRSAAVVTAIAVIGSLTVAGAATADVVADNEGGRMLPRDAVALIPNRDFSVLTTSIEVDYAPAPSRPTDDKTKAAIDAIVPSAVWHDRRVATWDPAPFAIAADGSWVSGTAEVELVVADEALMDLYELSDDERDQLVDIGVLAVSPQYVWSYSGEVPTENQLVLATEQGEIELDYARRDFIEPAGTVDDSDGDYIYGIDGFLITEDAARDAGLDLVTRGGFLRSDGLTEAQRNSVQGVLYGDGPMALGQYYRGVPAQSVDDGWGVIVDWGGYGMTPRSIQGILVAIALVLTLFVVAIGLALAAAEGVNERDVLVAVGGRPGTMRSMAGARATVLTFTGVALAVPFGLFPIYAVMRATEHRFEMPWVVVGVLLVAVPALAGGAAWLVSAVAQRIRPVQISNLAFD